LSGWKLNTRQCNAMTCHAFLEDGSSTGNFFPGSSTWFLRIGDFVSYIQILLYSFCSTALASPA
jgi:hypothetical protein